MKKDAIITFDYEVFLGRQTGTIINSVIKPTKLILEVLIQYHAKAIFFVDATWLLFIKDNFTSDFQLVSEQLKNIIKAGSTVELHLHPQWIQAYRIGDKIEFKSFENYRLHSLSQEGILDIFRKSIELLESITLQRIRCFRAGGFCIEPFHQIKSAFEKFDIKYDFSVAPGMNLKEGYEYDFDFSDIPRLHFYRFQYDVGISDPNGQFVELPLSTYQNNPAYRLINKTLLILKRDYIFGDGKGIQEKSLFFFRSLSRRFQFSTSMLTIDKTCNFFFKYLLKSHFRKSSLIVILSHPKILSRQAIINLSYIASSFNTLNSTDLKKMVNW